MNTNLIAYARSLWIVSVVAMTGCSAAGDPADKQNEAVESTSSALNARITVVDVQTGRCLDSNAAGSVYTGPCNGGNYQKWDTVNLPHGIGLVNYQTMLCLDSNASGSVYAIPCNYGNYEQWDFQNTTGSNTTIVDFQTGRCLDSNTSGSIYTGPCNGGNYQKWNAM